MTGRKFSTPVDTHNMRQEQRHFTKPNMKYYVLHTWYHGDHGDHNIMINKLIFELFHITVLRDSSCA